MGGFPGHAYWEHHIWANSPGGEGMSQADFRRWASQVEGSWHKGGLGIAAKSKGWQTRLPGFESQFCCFVAMWLLASYFPSPCFAVLIYEIGVMTSQGMAGYSPWAEFCLLIVFANKVLLQRSHIHLGIGYFHITMAELSLAETFWPEKLKIFIIWPFT